MKERPPRQTNTPIGERFVTIVDTAVSQAQNNIGLSSRTVYAHPAVEGQNRVATGREEVVFSSYYEDASEKWTSIQGLPFMPSHTIEILSHDSRGDIARQATFGIADDETIVRTQFEKSTFFVAPETTRPLDAEESVALLDYATSPHLQADKLEIATRHTDEEKQSIESDLERVRQAKRRLEESMAEINAVTDGIFPDHKIY